MKLLNFITITLAAGLLSTSCGNGGGTATDKKDSGTTPAQKNAEAAFDSVTIIDKESGKVLELTALKHDDSRKIKPGDTVEEAVVDEKTGDITGARLIVYKK